jgi:hypothetical protein
MVKRLKKIPTWILDIILLRPYPIDPEIKARPNPPPWDVPLDQTEAPMHYQGDTTSV